MLCKLQNMNVSFPASIVLKKEEYANFILFTFTVRKKYLGIKSRKIVYYTCVTQINY